MKRLTFFLLFAFTALAVFSTPGAGSERLPPYPSVKSGAGADLHEDTAWKLYQFARNENRGLRWDECLAGKAYQRAKKMLRDGYFDHEDPKTGRNPAWSLVLECRRFRCAGENLSRGSRSAAVIHDKLMHSRTHRHNILDSKFNYLGVGCYENICVELFAGA